MVRRSVQYLRMSPQTIAHQKVLSWQLSLPGKTLEQADGFGNVWTTLYLDQPHSLIYFYWRRVRSRLMTVLITLSMSVLPLRYFYIRRT